MANSKEGGVTRWRVLVVEDDPSQVHALVSLMPTFDVEAVGTAKEGLERLVREPKVDGVLLDLMLPNGKGLALVGAFHATYPDLPLFIYTAGDFSSEELIAAGACKVFRKAVTTPEELEDELVQGIVREHANRAMSSMELKAAAAQNDIDAVLNKLRASIRDDPAQGTPRFER